jgi:hypothetical protein
MAIRIGMTGSSVRMVQSALVAAGFSLRMDGHFGRQTAEAVADFQMRHDVPAHGVVDDVTAHPLGLRKLIDDGLATPLDFAALSDAVHEELLLRFTSSDTHGLARRRQRLRALFLHVSPDDAEPFRGRLTSPQANDELAHDFHGRLASAARNELLGLLETNHRRDDQVPRDDQIPVERILLLYEPLPADAEGQLAAAIDGFDDLLAPLRDLGLSQTLAERFDCWFAVLRNRGDDRVIRWSRICPPHNVPLIIGPCQTASFTFTLDDEQKLHNLITSGADVDQASDQQLHFIHHLRTVLVREHEWALAVDFSPSIRLDRLRLIMQDILNARSNLELWSTIPAGAGSSIPVAYLAIKRWLRERELDANSIYHCL